MANEKNKIVRKNWTSRFNVVGKARVNDYTFRLDQHSEKSSWCYNSMTLYIDCGEEFGSCRTDMMGGFAEGGNSVIYVHGKTSDGKDDFQNRFEVAWDDRFNEDILEEIGDMCFTQVELEKTKDGKNFKKKFLSPYDAIEYVHEYLEDGMVVFVTGDIKYSTYNSETQIQKNITRIGLSNVDDKSKYGAHFTQSVLIDNDSVNMKDIDKDKSVWYVNGYVLDYIKEINGCEIKGQYPFPYTFEYPVNQDKPDMIKKIYKKLFDVKKGVNQITFEGDFIESGATVTMTADDLPEDIASLVEAGVYTEEDAIAACATNGSRERRMLLKKPHIKNIANDDGTVTNSIQIFEGVYEEEDLMFDIPADEEPPFDSDDYDDDDDMDWLNDLA